MYGDGQTATHMTFSHTHRYTQPGSYTVTVAAIGPKYQVSATRTTYIQVLGADFTVSPPLGSPPLVVTLRDSYGGPAEKRLWDFGDGNPVQTTTAVTASHTYTTLGAYTVTLQVVRDGYTYTPTVSPMLFWLVGKRANRPPSVCLGGIPAMLTAAH